jgi:arginase
MPARDVEIIGAPLDLGQGRRGVDMGPSAMRYAGLEERFTALGCAVVDRGNIVTPEPEALEAVDPQAHYLPEILDACETLAVSVAAAVHDKRFPVVLGGDHSIAIGTLAGLAAAAGARGGAIWVDAHGDLNTPETSPSGNVHGMPGAAALGLAGPRFVRDGLALPAIDPERLVLVGVRSLDPAERTLVTEHGIRVITMSELDRIGMEQAFAEALERASGGAFVHLSFDLDALDPEIAPGVGTRVPGGLTYREAQLACELAAESGVVGSLELVEVNPILDRQNTTAITAVELAASTLGQTIL